MGIEDLLSGISKNCPNARNNETFLGAFSGCKLGIDISGYAYKFMAVARSESLRYIDFVREDPNPATLRSFWLEKCFDFAMLFIEELVNPVMVFDGPPFHLKQGTKEERIQKYRDREAKIAKLREELLELDNHETPMALKKKDDLQREIGFHIRFERKDWQDLEAMYRTMGISVIKATTEAEAICARLVRQGLVVGVVSNDGDALAHLAPIMIIDVKANYRHGRPMHRCTTILLENVLSSLKLSKELFVDFCMLLGTDYNTRIKGFGWTYALKELKQAGSLELAVEAISKKKAKKKEEKLKKGLEWEEPDMSTYRLTDKAMVNDIRSYFLKDLELSVEDNLVLFYDIFNGNDSFKGDVNFNELLNSDDSIAKMGNLCSCFEEIFTSFNRKRMLEKVSDVIKTLIAFNFRFSRLQKFVLENKF